MRWWTREAGIQEREKKKKDRSWRSREKKEREKSDSLSIFRTMDNLNNIRNPKSETVDRIFGSSRRQFFTCWEDVTLSYEWMLLCNRILHSTDTLFQHFTLVSTYLENKTRKTSEWKNRNRRKWKWRREREREEKEIVVRHVFRHNRSHLSDNSSSSEQTFKLCPKITLWRRNRRERRERIPFLVLDHESIHHKEERLQNKEMGLQIDDIVDWHHVKWLPQWMLLIVWLQPGLGCMDSQHIYFHSRWIDCKLILCTVHKTLSIHSSYWHHCSVNRILMNRKNEDQWPFHSLHHHPLLPNCWRVRVERMRELDMERERENWRKRERERKRIRGRRKKVETGSI